jgi:lysophospholipase L1-like esterase
MKRILVILFWALATLTAFGQTQPLTKKVPNYPFTHFERNRIVYPGDSLPMEQFFQKLDSVLFLGDGNVTIMHIGGSHVQAGVFTQQFRDNLLSIGTDLIGGQSFVFPFSAGSTNNPSYYMVKYTGSWDYCRNAVKNENEKRMGLAGAAITTADSIASVSIITRERYPSLMPPVFDFNKVTLLGFADTVNVEPLVSYDGTTIRAHRDEQLSSYTLDLPSYTDSIHIYFDSIPGEFTITGILLESEKTGINVHGIGVNGASVPSYLRCEDFERDLALIKPDLVIFGIGINDAAEKDFDKWIFKQNYKELIKIIQRVNPDCAMLFMTNNDSFKRIKKNKYQVNENGLVAQQAFMEMGKKYNAAVWDQFDIMGGLNSMKEWEDAGLAKKDKVHFTNEGYRLLGDLLYNAFIDRYIEHIKSTAKRP